MTGAGARMAPHVPVLVDEVVAALAVQDGDIVVDGTFGAGGYTRALLEAGASRVIGFDRDPDAIAAGQSLVSDHRLTLVEERFSQMDRVLADRGVGSVDAIALDIGISSMQIDQAERGFSFQADGPLDMRMEQSGLTAAEYLNAAEMNVSIYNLPKCVLPRSVWPHALQSISDWKNGFVEECDRCEEKSSCSGFFNMFRGIKIGFAHT